MSLIDSNNNYYELNSPTGRDIQGIVPLKKYYVLKKPFQQPLNSNILTIPIAYRTSVNDNSNQYIYITIQRTASGYLQPFIINKTNYDLTYISIIEQQYNNTIQQKNYLQRDSNYTKVASGQTAQNSFLTQNALGTSTDKNNLGNDRGSFNLNININDHNLNIIGTWYTPLINSISDTNNPAYNGLITLETIDDYIDLV